MKLKDIFDKKKDVKTTIETTVKTTVEVDDEKPMAPKEKDPLSNYGKV